MAGAAKGGGNPAAKGSGMPQPNMMVSSECQAMMEGRRNTNMKIPKKMQTMDPAEMMKDPHADE